MADSTTLAGRIERAKELLHTVEHAAMATVNGALRGGGGHVARDGRTEITAADLLQ